MSTLGEDFPKEQERLRELLEDYKAIGPSGTFGYLMISNTLREANEAAISGDLPRMIRAYQQMKDCE